MTRSLADFAKLVELFDAHGVSFISVTQAFNTTTSMGRLTLNMLLSFAQFEREITGERIRDKVAASKRKGIWMGGAVSLGYRVEDRALLPTRKPRRFAGTAWWAMQGSNLRPLPCEGSASFSMSSIVTARDPRRLFQPMTGSAVGS